MRRRLVVASVVTIASAASILAASPAMAHPLGNFTHNTYVGLTVTPNTVTVDHVLDLAEIPTYQLQSQMDIDGNGKVSGDEAAIWGRARCAAAASEITATTDAGSLTWAVGESTVRFPAGQAGLPTTRLECALSADVAGVTSLEVDVSIERGRVGWHEVTAIGEGVDLTADVPTTTSSARLTAYPLDVAPADLSTASLSWGTAGQVAQASTARGQEEATPVASSAITAVTPLGLDSAAQAFTDLVGRQDVTFGFALLALVISLVLGGVHALAPGHGKTLMAASLVGTAGRRRDAVVLGASVTAAHTAGVVVLALVLSISSTIAAESAYPWLGLASAVIAVGVGISLFRQARRGGGLHGHSHGHGHSDGHGHDDHGHHGHHGHDHGHDHGHHGHDDHGHHGHDHGPAHGSVITVAPDIRTVAAAAPARPATRRIVALGLAGGLIPSPSAVVVLLAGFALGRSWFALMLVVAYGLGMALTLCLVGVVLVRAGAFSRRVVEGDVVPRPVAAILNRLPLIAATVVVAAGLWLGVRSFLSM